MPFHHLRNNTEGINNQEGSDDLGPGRRPLLGSGQRGSRPILRAADRCPARSPLARRPRARRTVLGRTRPRTRNAPRVRRIARAVAGVKWAAVWKVLRNAHGSVVSSARHSIACDIANRSTFDATVTGRDARSPRRDAHRFGDQRALDVKRTLHEMDVELDHVRTDERHQRQRAPISAHVGQEVDLSSSILDYYGSQGPEIATPHRRDARDAVLPRGAVRTRRRGVPGGR